MLTSKAAIPLKPTPPNFRNDGNYTISVSKLGRFLADKAEEAGVYILSETAATKLLVEDRIVKGVRSGDRGRGKDGEELGNFEPGSDVVAKATVLAEGTVGHLTYAAYDYFDMRGGRPEAWELGVKEVWEVPKPLDRVIHTIGWPLRWSRRSSTRSAAASSTRWARTRFASASSSVSTTPTPPSAATTRCS